MSIGLIILGVILLALIPTHWFLGGVAISELTGISSIFIGLLWLGMLVGGVASIIIGLTG